MLPFPMRTAFVHIGTHKTGTTSIQAMLAMNAPAFRVAGLFVPETGRSNPAYAAHHNIAWQLSGDRRFDAHDGTLADLLGEITSAGSPNVCLSSEDFEFLHGNEPALLTLRDAFAGIGYAVTIVLYLRPQADYLESLYAEICPVWNVAFADFLDRIIAEGGYGGTLFDYDCLIDRFTAVFGTDRVIVRAYRAADPAHALMHAFARIVTGDRALAELRVPSRLNTMRSFAAVVAARERIAGGRICFLIPPAQAFDPLSLGDIARIVARFTESNERINRHRHLHLTAATPATIIREILSELFHDRESRYRKQLIRAMAADESALLVKA